MGKFWDVVVLIYKAKKLESAFEKINKSKNYGSAELFEQADGYYQDVSDKLASLSQSAPGAEAVKQLSENLATIPQALDYMRSFSQKDFRGAMEKAQKIGEGSAGAGHLALMGCVQALDALNEIKARGGLDEELKVEQTVLKARLHGMAGVTSGGDSAVKLKYNGAFMSLGYNAWLEGDKQEALECFMRQWKLYGEQEVTKAENPARAPWFYDNVSAEYSKFLAYGFENAKPAAKAQGPKAGC